MDVDAPARLVNRTAALQAFPTLTHRMGHWLRVADPIGDRTVAATHGWAPGRLFGEVDEAIRTGEAAAPEIAELVEQARGVPAWVDFDRIDRGASFFLSTHVIGGLVLGARSLILGYAAPAGNKPLVMSGRLEQGVNRRLAETSRFVVDVTRPGGLRPLGAGVAAAVKVRLIHAKVRQMIHRSEGWNDDWGAPINQHDMMGTVLLFGLVLLQGLETLGLQPTHDEAEDYIALWRYVGYLLGVDQELLPGSRAEAQRYKSFVDLTQAPPDDDARRLTRAFLSAGAEEGGPRNAAVGHALARELLGKELADGLGVNTSRFQLVMPLVRVAVRRLNHLRRRPSRARAAAQAGSRYWEWVLANNPVGPVDLTMPDSLLRTTLTG